MRVAIVNDMRLATEALRHVVLSDPDHVVAWTAADGEEAVRRCEEDTPDVVLMDLVMPEMNGAEATREIMRRCPCPIMVVTATVTCPPTAAVRAGADPSKGTWTNLTFSLIPKDASDKCCTLPAPACPAVTTPGFAFAKSIKSFRLSNILHLK